MIVYLVVASSNSETIHLIAASLVTTIPTAVSQAATNSTIFSLQIINLQAVACQTTYPTCSSQAVCLEV